MGLMPICWRQEKKTDAHIACRVRRPTRRRCILLFALVSSVLALTVAGCSNPEFRGGGVTFVTFSAATSYEDALSAVTDVGLRPVAECGILPSIATVNADGTPVTYWSPWSPESQREYYYSAAGQSRLPSLIIGTTPLAPSDWQDRLLKISGVQGVMVSHGPFACTEELILTTPPTGSDNDILLPSQIGVYAQVTFDQSPTPVYGDALDDVLNLGLRLADPCYEKALADGKSPAWHTMGQEDAYAANHTLHVATTNETGNLWQQQVQALPASVSVDSNATGAC